jgi:hypothetical protein
VDEFGNGGLLVVSNTAGAAGEHEQVYLFRDIYLELGEDFGEVTRSTRPPPLYKGIPSKRQTYRRNLAVAMR